MQNLHLNCREQAIVPEGGTFYEQFEPAQTISMGIGVVSLKGFKEFFTYRVFEGSSKPRAVIEYV